MHQTFMVTVNYGESVEVLADLGHYHFIDPGITIANFPSREQETRSLEIVLMESPEQIKEQGLRPCVIHELLSLGIEAPELRFSIPALGSPWQDPQNDVIYFPCIAQVDGERILDLGTFFGVGDRVRYAGVRK